MKKLIPFTLIIVLFGCSDGNQPNSSSASITTLQAASTIVPTSDVEKTSAVTAASGVMNASEVISAQPASGVLPNSVEKIEETMSDSDAIIKWAKLDSNAKVEEILPVRLIDGEDALIAKIDRFQGRNNMYGAYLVRPSRKEAREVASSIHDLQTIQDSSDYSNRIAVIKSGASGQGNENYRWSIVYFDDWKMVALHELDFSNSGACFNFPGMGYSCSQSKVTWDYEIDQNDLILKETVIHSEWKELTACKIPADSTVTTYRIKNLALSIESSHKSSMTIDVDCPQKHQKKQK